MNELHASDAAFHRRAEEATGLSWNDIIALGEAQERERTARIHAAGYCCEAGAINAPDVCPWHPGRDAPDPRA